ncbi:hypothetical protein D9M68_488340 [compost metagenome]
MRGFGAGRDEIQAGRHLVAQHLVQGRAHQDLGQAGTALHIEAAMQVAAAQVGVDQDHAPAAAGQCGEVGADERLAHARRRAAQQHHAVAVACQRELQRGTEAAQAFHRRIVGMLARQQARVVLARRLQRFLLGAVWDGRVHGQAGALFDLVRIGDTATERIAHEGHQQPRQHADQRGQSGNHGAVRALRPHRHLGRIDQARAADLARLHQLELLHVVEQRLQHLGADFDVAHQAQHVLLDIGQLLDAPGDAVELAAQAGDLAIDDLERGVVVGVARGQLLALGAQFLQLGLDLHGLRQDELGFLAQVDGPALVAHGVVPVLGGLDLLPQLGQLPLEEGQRLLRLFRLAAQVLIDVFASDVIEDGRGLLRRAPFQRHGDHAALLAAFRDLQVVLQLRDGLCARMPAQHELRAGPPVELADEQFDVAAAGLYAEGRPDHADRGGIVAGEADPVLALIHGGQHELAALHLRGHFQAWHGDRLLAPGKAAPAQQARRGKLFVEARDRLAQHREVARRRLDVEPQVVHRLAHHHARAQQFDLAGGACLDVERRGDRRREPARIRVGIALLHLHHDVGAVDGTGQEREEQSHAKNRPRHREEGPPVAQQYIDVRGQVDRLVAIGSAVGSVVPHIDCSHDASP